MFLGWAYCEYKDSRLGEGVRLIGIGCLLLLTSICTSGSRSIGRQMRRGSRLMFSVCSKSALFWGWVVGMLTLGRIVENTLVIICGCLPACYPFLASIVDRRTNKPVEAILDPVLAASAPVSNGPPLMREQRASQGQHSNTNNQFYNQVGTASAPRPAQTVSFRSERYA